MNLTREGECLICDAPAHECECDLTCTVEDCASAPRYECGWCNHAVCPEHANDYSGLCPECQREYEADQA